MAFAEYYDKIEDYIKGRLPEAERKAFESEMASNPDLAEEVALHEEMMQASGEPEIADFRKMMEGILAETPQPRSSKWNKKQWWFIGLSLFLAVVAIGTWKLSDRFPPAKPVPPAAKSPEENTEPPVPPEVPIAKGKEGKPEPPKQKPGKRASPEDMDSPYVAIATNLYNQQPYEIRLRNIASSSQEETLLQKAEQAYRDSSYVEVIQLLAKPVEGYASESFKLRAHTYFRTGQFARAAENFQPLRTGRYKYDAEWYLLLCYLAQLPATKLQFDELAEQIIKVETHSFRVKTLNLLETLKANSD